MFEHSFTMPNGERDSATFLFALLGIFVPLAAFMPVQAHAQSLPRAPEFRQMDENGMNLFSGALSQSIELGSIGSGESKLSYIEYWNEGGRQDTLFGTINRSQDDVDLSIYADVTVGDYSRRFKRVPDGNGSATSGPYATTYGAYEQLLLSNDGTTWTLILQNGEQLIFGVPLGASSQGLCSSTSGAACGSLLLSRTLRNGARIDYTWQVSSPYVRPIAMQSTYGYKIVLTYPYLQIPTSAGIYSMVKPLFVSRVDFFNLASSPNSLYSAYRSLNSFGIVDYASVQTDTTVTTVDSRIWQIVANNILGVRKLKTPVSPSFNITYDGSLSGGSFFKNGRTTIYSLNRPNNISGVMARTDPDGSIWKFNFAIKLSKVVNIPYIQSFTDPLLRPTQYGLNADQVVNKITRPEGDVDRVDFDSRTNVVALYNDAKRDSTLSTLVSAASYPSECANPLTCNQPTTVTDGRGAVSNYEYDNISGQLQTEILPGDAAGVRPVKRYRYAQRSAWVLNGSGGYVTADSPVWVKTEERTCRTSATINDACQGGSADEVVTTYDYGPDSGPNNLLLRGVTVSGGGTVQRTCFTYDATGNKISETKPNGTGASCS